MASGYARHFLFAPSAFANHLGKEIFLTGGENFFKLHATNCVFQS